MRIWKFPLVITDRQVVSVPVGAQMLDVQMQGDTPCLWAMCREASEPQPRTIAIYGTGNPLPATPGRYIATFQESAFVWHVFDLGRP